MGAPQQRAMERDGGEAHSFSAMHAIRSLLRRHALVRLYLVSILVGFCLSAVFVGALTAFDVGGIATLALRRDAWPFLIVLWFFTGLTFASAQAGMAVMSLADEAGGGGPPRPAVVRVERKR